MIATKPTTQAVSGALRRANLAAPATKCGAEVWVFLRYTTRNNARAIYTALDVLCKARGWALTGSVADGALWDMVSVSLTISEAEAQP